MALLVFLLWWGEKGEENLSEKKFWAEIGRNNPGSKNSFKKFSEKISSAKILGLIKKILWNRNSEGKVIKQFLEKNIRILEKNFGSKIMEKKFWGKTSRSEILEKNVRIPEKIF